MTKYAGTRAIVVGATDVGLAIAKRLVEGGAQVVLADPGAGGPATADLGSGVRLLAGTRAGAVAEVLDGLDLVFAAGPPDARPLLPLLADGGAIVLLGPPPADEEAVRALAVELAGRGVRVNAVATGFLDPAPGVPLDHYADLRERCDARTPLRRLGAPDEVARAALFLAADATFTTGARLPVDGGLTLHD
ncbi:SDR family NAD(P)-dependent oxidoreductase [Actinomadura hibisca]|uniref:SDR family NAD(P)-dependent oxidoreductase n=1 Tax=Actinomadura hibisca TaxID=68565 RepID=UPI00082A9D87|nr:SDR family oxidoreductase [Actinomadura hibisca]